MRICTLGDLLLDVIVRQEEEPATPAYERRAQTLVGAGGQAANVAAWTVTVGAEARFVGKRGTDAAAEIATREVEERGVEVVGPLAEGRNGVVVSIVGADGGRTMISDRGIAPELRAEELDLDWFRGCEWLHIAGYSLFRGPIDEAAAKAVGAIRALGGRLSVDLSSASAIEVFGADRLLDRLALLSPDVVFANEDEQRALGATVPDAVTVLKRGPHGIVVDEVSFPALPADVVDSTGAGDALAAGFLVGGAQLALETAARCVGQLGAMPPATRPA
ncbi:MAG TPA: carbohydrate kinase family protein [Gaiellaceae bacterium]|nr:carbohydrate kinase family protein [Gaiellaceae bacterium]